MITAERQIQWYRRQLGAVTIGNPDVDWLERIRQQARVDLARQPAMNRKQESWRYTSVEKLLETEFSPPRRDMKPNPNILEDHTLPELDGYRLFFHNGRYVPMPAAIGKPPKGILIGSLRACVVTEPDLLSRYLGQVAGQPANFFSSLNNASIDDGLLLYIDANTVIDRPIQVVHVTEGPEQTIMVQPRHLILLERDAKATLVEHFVGNSGSHYFQNNLTEIMLGEGASLSHFRLQDEAPQSYHLSNLYLRQEGRSKYRGTSLSFGANWSRVHFNTAFMGEDAELDLSGLYTVGSEQLNDFHLDVRHSVPACTSRAHFKGIAYGHGRAVFDGRVLVERQAQGTDAQLKNDNLMLSRKAEIDTKPQLEIFADDVKCSHGTTVGQIEPEQLFYLRSRGISTEAAKRMLCRGFAGAIIDRVEPEAVRSDAYGKLAAALDDEISSE